MICFKDMSFCSAKCSNQDCFRQFTTKEREEAIKWWGNENAPVAFMDFSSGCPKYIPMENDNEIL